LITSADQLSAAIPIVALTISWVPLEFAVVGFRFAFVFPAVKSRRVTVAFDAKLFPLIVSVCGLVDPVTGLGLTLVIHKARTVRIAAVVVAEPAEFVNTA
jgi:hypothetical protein